METPPSIMKIQAYQLPIFFNNNTTINTTTSVMETPQLHNIRSSTPAFTQNLGSNDNNIIPIDISFSSYLKPPLLLDESEISIFDAQKYFNESNQGPKSRSSSFSQPPVIKNNDTNISRLSSVDGYNRARSFHATPTASSEASWNSQTGLLSNPPGALAVSLRNPPCKSSKSDTQRDSKRGGISNRTTGGTKWVFRRKCPCSGKKSVQVEELVNISESKTMSPAPYTKKQIPDHPHTHQNQNNMGQTQETITENFDRREQRLNSSATIQENERFPTKVVRQPRFSTSGRPLNDVPVGGFSFPILRNPALPQQSSLDDPPRESLEVFQPRVEEQPRRKSGGRGFGFPGSPRSMEDDMASDASSDLFEIESFSTQTTCYRRRDSLDEAQNFLTARRLAASNIYCNRRSMDEPTTPNSIAQTEYCYEPSEASIDWSVTTAQEFERSSVTNFSISASEVGDAAANGRLAWVVNNSIGGAVGRKKGNGEGGERRVAAGGDTGQHGGGLMGPSASTVAGKLPLMSTFMHVSSRAGAGSSNPNANIIKPPPIARSHSARLSLAFAA